MYILKNWKNSNLKQSKGRRSESRCKNSHHVRGIRENREFHRREHRRVARHLEGESLMALLKAAAHYPWTWFWTRTRQTRGWSRFLRFQHRFPAISPPEILLPDIGSCIFYDHLRYTGPLALKKRARELIEKSFPDKILPFLLDSSPLSFRPPSLLCSAYFSSEYFVIRYFDIVNGFIVFNI